MELTAELFGIDIGLSGWQRGARSERLHLTRHAEGLRTPFVDARIRRIESSHCDLRNCGISCPVALIRPKAESEAEADAAEGTAIESERCKGESFSAVDGRPPDECSTCCRSTPRRRRPLRSSLAAASARRENSPTASAAIAR